MKLPLSTTLAPVVVDAGGGGGGGGSGVAATPAWRGDKAALALRVVQASPPSGRAMGGGFWMCGRRFPPGVRGPAPRGAREAGAALVARRAATPAARAPGRPAGAPPPPPPLQAVVSIVLLTACGRIEELYGSASLGLFTGCWGAVVAAAYLATPQAPRLQE
jgi:hypothetical protein